jgi:hypothetical protein
MWFLLLLFILLASPLEAHVGSTDVYYEGTAGPYLLMVTVRPPDVVPGVAEIEILAASNDIREVRITPLRLTGPGANFAPTPDLAHRAKGSPKSFLGSLWLMEQGGWKVRIEVDGVLGRGELSVPVTAVAQQTLGMQRALGIFLAALMLFLATGAVSIVGASVREGQLEPGASPTGVHLRQARVMMATSAILVLASMVLGNIWWNSIARSHERGLYKLPQLSASLEAGGRLLLRLPDPELWKGLRLGDNPLIPDHNHLMHLFVVRVPEMERFWHLHPEQTEYGVFSQELPAVPAGHYQIFADVVHRSGFPETAVTEIDLPDVSGKPPTGDDSEGIGPPLSQADRNRNVSLLSDGARMIWERDPSPLKSKRPDWFRFRVDHKDGRPANDLELYMGMAGHAIFLRTDRSVFAHVHPSGTPPMAMLALAQTNPTADASAPHAKHNTNSLALPPLVSFPYGFPRPGDYRIYVQIKRAGHIETGVFDARVEP